MSLVIGLTGEKGGGKGTFTKVLHELLDNHYSIDRVGSSDILVTTLKTWHIEVNRENLQKLPILMESAYGKGSLSRAMKKRIDNCSGDIVIVDAIRLLPDVPMLNEYKNNLLVYVTADFETRLRRTQDRKRIGEENVTREQFAAEELADTEIHIPEIGARADFKIDNNSDSMDHFTRQVQLFINTYGL